MLGHEDGRDLGEQRVGAKQHCRTLHHRATQLGAQQRLQRRLLAAVRLQQQQHVIHHAVGLLA